MEELKKIKRTVAKQLEGAPHETLLVLDATTGQNALSQAKLLNEAIGISGLVLTKLDGTAKGGIVIGISSSLKVPLQYIGIGEQIEDLRPFDAKQFIDALF
jgi:fused signal recognition particle receptor